MVSLAYINPDMLRYVRRKRRVSIDRLARLAGIKSDTLMAWESGKRTPTFPAIDRISNILEFPHGMLWLSKAFNGRNRFPTRKEYRKIIKAARDYRLGRTAKNDAT